MKTIQLTKGYVALVDDEDYRSVIKYSWYIQNHTCIYAARRINSTLGSEYLHNFLMSPPKGFTVDHIDRNGLNCQRYNMRLATRSQQNANRERPYNSTTLYRGVYKSKNRWIAKLGYNGTRYYAGSFESIEDAARAYDKLAKQHHGEFAVLNFPERK